MKINNQIKDIVIMAMEMEEEEEFKSWEDLKVFSRIETSFNECKEAIKEAIEEKIASVDSEIEKYDSYPESEAKARVMNPLNSKKEALEVIYEKGNFTEASSEASVSEEIEVEVISFDAIGRPSEVKIDGETFKVASAGQDSCVGWTYDGGSHKKAELINSAGEKVIFSRNLVREEKEIASVLSEAKKIIDKVKSIDDDELKTQFLKETGLNKTFLIREFGDCLYAKNNDFKMFERAVAFKLSEKKNIANIFSKSEYKFIFNTAFNIAEEKHNIEDYNDFCMLVFEQTEDYENNLPLLVKELREFLNNDDIKEMEEWLQAEAEMYGETKEDYFKLVNWDEFKNLYKGYSEDDLYDLAVSDEDSDIAEWSEASIYEHNDEYFIDVVEASEEASETIIININKDDEVLIGDVVQTSTSEFTYDNLSRRTIKVRAERIDSDYSDCVAFSSHTGGHYGYNLWKVVEIIGEVE